jgi:hypothetical protein
VEPAREDELLESLFVELDPLVGTGVLVEVWRVEGGYVLLETAATGNRLLRFASKDGGLVYALLEQEPGHPRG